MASNSSLEFDMNPERLIFLLDMFQIKKEDLVAQINGNLKSEIISLSKLDNILKNKEKVSLQILKKIDNIFEKGISWYVSKRSLPDRKKSSIFFRKDSFNSELNFESKKRVANLEELKIEIGILSKQIGYKKKRDLELYSVKDDPKNVAINLRNRFEKIRNELLEKKKISNAKGDRDFIEQTIRVFEEMGIFVFEFIDRKRKVETMTNFNGLFISPNIIAIKRQQKYLRREIFTLIHEFAHFLLNEEEVDEDVGESKFHSASKEEEWCNTFSFYFLLGDSLQQFDNLTFANEKNNYLAEEINDLRDKTKISRLAFYTCLKINKKIEESQYNRIKNEIYETINEERDKEQREFEKKKELAEAQGKEFFVSSPKEIKSKLFEDIVRINFFEGKISESELRQYLKISDKKLIEEVLY